MKKYCQKLIAAMLAMALCVSIVGFAMPSLYAASGDSAWKLIENAVGAKHDAASKMFHDSVFVKNNAQGAKGITVTVDAEEGAFPKGAALWAEFVSAAEKKAVSDITEDARGSNARLAASYTFNVKILDNTGKQELQPADGKKVWVSFSIPEVANENLNTHVFHMKEQRRGLTAEELKVETDSETATVETDGFSYYTVEFTYGDIEFVLPGGAEILLSELLEKIGIHGEVESWEVSAPELFNVFLGAYYGVIYESADESIPTNDGDIPWLLSLQPFDTTEWLKVVVDGIEYEITVTDDNTTQNVPSNNFYSAVETNLDNDPAVTSDSFYTNATKPTIVKQSTSSTSCTDFAAGLPLSTIFIDTSKVASGEYSSSVSGTFKLLATDTSFKDGIEEINGKVNYNPLKKGPNNEDLGLLQVAPGVITELPGDLYSMTFADAAILPDGSRADLRITFSNAKIAVDERLGVTDTASNLTPSNYQGAIGLSNGASINYGGTDNRWVGTDKNLPAGCTEAFTAAQRNAMAKAVKTTAGKFNVTSGGGPATPQLGHTMDVTYHIVKNDIPIDGTFIFAMAGINLDRDPYRSGGNNYGKPLWYYNLLGATDTDNDDELDFFPNETYHFFSESVSINSGMVSDYIYVRPNSSVIEVNDNTGSGDKSHYYPQVIMENNKVRFIANASNSLQGQDTTYSSGFVLLADAKTGLKITATGHGCFSGSMNTQVFTGKQIWYRYISSTGRNGNIQSTSEGNFDGTLDDTSDSEVASKILDPGTYVVPEGKTVTYTMEPMEGYQIAKLQVKNANGVMQEIKYNGSAPLYTMQEGQTTQFRDAANQLCTLTALANGKFKLEMPYAKHNEEVHVEWQRTVAQVSVKKESVNNVNGNFPFKIRAWKNEDVTTRTLEQVGFIMRDTTNTDPPSYLLDFEDGTTCSYSEPSDLADIVDDIVLTERIEIGAGEFLWKTDKKLSDLGISCTEKNDDDLFVGFINAPSAVVGDTLDKTLNTNFETVKFYHPNTETENVTTYWNFQSGQGQTTKPNPEWYTFNVSTNETKTFTLQRNYNYEIYELTPTGWELISVDNDANKDHASGILQEGQEGGSAPVHTFLNLKRLELTVKKLVDGTGASRNKYFKFTVNFYNCEPNSALAVDLSNASATPQENAMTIYTNMSNPSSIAIGNDGTGSATFYLRHDESITVKGLLVQGAGYTVTEDYEKYQPSLAITGDNANASGTIPSGTNVFSATDNSLTQDHTMLTFTNTRTLEAPTGLFFRIGASAGALLAGTIMTTVFLPGRKRRKIDNEDEVPLGDE